MLNIKRYQIIRRKHPVVKEATRSLILTYHMVYIILAF